MYKTKIVTSFLKNSNKILLLKRSEKVKSMKNLWAGISGIIEEGEEPLNRAKIEIFEEVGIKESEVTLLKTGKKMIIESPQYTNHQWEVYPFLFSCSIQEIKLNWENSDSRWIEVGVLDDFTTDPRLYIVLASLL